MSRQGVTTRLAPASKEEQRGQHVPGLLNGVHSDVTHQVSRVVLKQACIHGLDQRELSDQLPDSGSTSLQSQWRKGCMAAGQGLSKKACTIAGSTSAMVGGFHLGALSLSMTRARTPSTVSLAVPGRR